MRMIQRWRRRAELVRHHRPIFGADLRRGCREELSLIADHRAGRCIAGGRAGY